MLETLVVKKGGGLNLTKKTPKFKTYQEEANFWDNHDASDYFDHGRKTTLDFSKTEKKKESLMTVRLQPEIKIRLNSIAEDLGTQASTLTRMWVIEKLKSLNAV